MWPYYWNVFDNCGFIVVIISLTDNYPTIWPKQQQQDNLTFLPHPSKTDRRHLNWSKRPHNTTTLPLNVLRHWNDVFKLCCSGNWKPSSPDHPERSVTQPEKGNGRPVLSKRGSRCLTGSSSHHPNPFTWPVSQKLHSQHQQPPLHLARQLCWVPHRR